MLFGVGAPCRHQSYIFGRPSELMTNNVVGSRPHAQSSDYSDKAPHYERSRDDVDKKDRRSEMNSNRNYEKNSGGQDRGNRHRDKQDR
jgi:hypothetical protein